MSAAVQVAKDRLWPKTRSTELHLDDVEDRDVLGLVILLGTGMGRDHDVLGLQQPPHHIQHCTPSSCSVAVHPRKSALHGHSLTNVYCI